MDLEKMPVATLSFKYDKLYIPKWVQQSAGIKGGDKFVFYQTDREGVYLLIKKL